MNKKDSYCLPLLQVEDRLRVFQLKVILLNVQFELNEYPELQHYENITYIPIELMQSSQV